jgi:hypothetical protein
LPSGAVATSRIIFGAKSPASSLRSKRSGSATVCSTCAVNGICVGVPSPASTRHSLPLAHTTSALESGVQS